MDYLDDFYFSLFGFINQSADKLSVNLIKPDRELKKRNWHFLFEKIVSLQVFLFYAREIVFLGIFYDQR